MTERTDQLTRSDDSSLDAGSLDGGGVLDDGPAEPRSTAGGDESADQSRFRQYFSPRAFLVVFGVLAVLGQVASVFLPLGPIAGALGVFAGAFAVGLGSGKRRYGETAVAGAALGGLATLVGNLPWAFATGNVVPFAAVGTGLGVLVALLGAYFGRDLRKGLTEDI